MKMISFRDVKSQEVAISVITSFALAFLLITFNRNLGLIYLAFLFIDWNIFQDRQFASYPTLRGLFNPLVAGFLTLVVLGAFLLVSSGVLGYLLPAFKGNIFSFLAQETAPILSTDKTLNFIAYGILAPVVETRLFFGRLLEFLGHYLSIPLTFGVGIKQLFVYTLTSLMFTIFHLQAKLGLAAGGSEVGLLLTFIFGLFSCYLVVHTKQLLEAKLFHIGNNSLALAVKQGIVQIGQLATGA